IGTSDQVMVSGWFNGAASQIERIGAGDGRSLSNADVAQLVQAMASFAPPAAGQSTLPVDYQNALAPTLAAAWR
ncbi:calcium-binding protein, partial [Pseudacidovorax intermedius]|uniref:calcium-binding protein n=1 Tax=Pseudacidovorax intermedius TaxID=433924 RepID=UPI0005BD6217